MDKQSNKLYVNFLLVVWVVFLVLPSIHCAPQSDLFDAVFQSDKQCADLESQGYEGYECTPRKRCDDGYIIDSAIDGTIIPFYVDEDDEDGTVDNISIVTTFPWSTFIALISL
jgi:hypothetical protein